MTGTTGEVVDAVVIICAYTPARWGVLTEAIDALRQQTRAPSQIVLVIDGNPSLLQRAREAFPDLHVVANAHGDGLSGGRNTGYDESTASVLVFLDDDAVPEPEWLERLIAPLHDERVIGTGGALTPRWEGDRPMWLTDEFLWTVGCSYTGMPTSQGPIRNPIGASMTVRRSAYELTGGFHDALARQDRGGKISGTADETEFCIRALFHDSGSHWLYVPDARAHHHVSLNRTTWDYFRMRCATEGAAKAVLTDLAGTQAGLASERTYVRSVLPRALMRELRALLRGDRRGGQALRGIIGGFGYTASAYGRARMARRIAHLRSSFGVTRAV